MNQRSLPPVPVRSPLPSGLRRSTVAVIGGSSGIGFAAAKLLEGVGAQVVLVGRDQGKLDAAIAQLRGDRSSAIGIAAELGDEERLGAIFDQLGMVDHVLLTAGGLDGIGGLQSIGRDDVHTALDVRVWGALTIARVAGPRLPLGGSITLTSGIHAVRPLPGMSGALAALGAVESLTRALAVELAPRRIRVNAIRYGHIDTAPMRKVSGLNNDEAVKNAGAAMLLGRFATPEEAGAMALFLMANNAINGQVVTVDGGQSLT